MTRFSLQYQIQYTNYYYITIALVPNPAGNRPLNSGDVYRFLFGDMRHISLEIRYRIWATAAACRLSKFTSDVRRRKSNEVINYNIMMCP